MSLMNGASLPMMFATAPPHNNSFHATQKYMERPKSDKLPSCVNKHAGNVDGNGHLSQSIRSLLHTPMQQRAAYFLNSKLACTTRTSTQQCLATGHDLWDQVIVVLLSLANRQERYHNNQ